MGGGKKNSSSGFFSILKFFSSKNKSRAGYCDSDYDSRRKRWPSDEDQGIWGAAIPNIDIKAQEFIDKHYNRISKSEHHQDDISKLSTTKSKREIIKPF
ncbi:hypothetical protein L195_g027765 [Trifolium pratense]|uniref:Uncharacterized protein n=1 Tax=Trifolium pratense TaxID=57577 RepID=A0A2K3L048_TRIPR|nr:hypothetical protein L195_g027765 [Trifolium pratense]